MVSVFVGVSQDVADSGLDEFDDFQQALSIQPANPSTPKPAASNNAGLFDLLGSTSTAAVSSQPQNRMSSLSSPLRSSPPATTPNYTSMMSPVQPKLSNPTRPSYISTSGVTAKPAGASTFDDLWTTSLGSIGSGGKANGANGQPGGAASGKTIKDLEKEKAMSSLWGSGEARMDMGTGQIQAQSPAKPSFNGGGGGGGGGDDLLL